MDKYGKFEFEKEYFKIQGNVKAFWEAKNAEDKISAYIKFKYAYKVLEYKKRTSLIDFEGTPTNAMGMKASPMYLLGEFQQATRLLEQTFRSNLDTMVEEVLNHIALEDLYAKEKAYAISKESENE